MMANRQSIDLKMLSTPNECMPMWWNKLLGCSGEVEKLVMRELKKADLVYTIRL